MDISKLEPSEDALAIVVECKGSMGLERVEYMRDRLKGTQVGELPWLAVDKGCKLHVLRQSDAKLAKISQIVNCRGDANSKLSEIKALLDAGE